ncbi:MAG: hypothetical protein ABSE40_19335 [Candidatus Sulfotelmatobacter sp.]
MSNWIDYGLDVLASNQDEMNQIAERLNQPSQELANWVAQRFEQPVSEVTEGLKRLLEFKAVKNLGYLNNSVNKARRFSISFNDKRHGIVWSHLLEVSGTFPAAIFLLEYCDEGVSYAGKKVIRAGKVVQEVHDGDQQVQGLDWALLDIFAPFRTEYYGETAEFGSLWQPWLDAVIAAARQLKDDQTPASQGSTEVTGQVG